MSNPAIEWASENPLVAGVAAIGVVVVAMMIFGGGSEGGDSSGGGAVAAYYAAVGQQTQAGNAVQIAQIQAQAGTNQALIAATYGLDTARVTADVSKTAIGAAERVAYDSTDRDRFVAASQERLGANVNSANVQIAAHQASAQKSVAKSSNPTAFSQNIGAVGGFVSNVGSTLSKFF